MKAWAKVFGSDKKLLAKTKDPNRDSKVASRIPHDACTEDHVQQCMHKMRPPSRALIPARTTPWGVYRPCVLHNSVYVTGPEDCAGSKPADFTKQSVAGELPELVV